MKKYALIQNGKVHEIITIDDNTPPITDRYHPDFIACMSDVTLLIPQPQIGWLFSWETGQFAEPLGYVETPIIDGMLSTNTEPPVLPEDTPKETALNNEAFVELMDVAVDEATHQ